MPLYFNGEYLDTDSLQIQSSDRGLRFGDGLFETIIYGGSLPESPSHNLNRLKEGCDVLGLNFPKDLNVDSLQAIVHSLTQTEEAPRAIRTRIMLWRKGAGIYAPSQTESNLLISADAFTPAPPQNKLRLEVCENTRLVHSAYSHCKTISALPYVMAAKECRDRNADELLLLDAFGNISECVSSNIFWKSGGQWMTPALSTGCVAGTVRDRILAKAKQSGISVTQISTDISSLAQAESAFTCNVAGIRSIGSFNGRQLPESEILPV